MKDINLHISRRRQRFELISFAVCFIIAFLLNVYAVNKYNAPWTELITSVFYVVTFAVVLYLVWICLRIIACPLIKRIKSKNK